jgi:hypothetical protein
VQLCLAGTYQPAEGQTQCPVCDANYIRTNEGLSDPDISTGLVLSYQFFAGPLIASVCTQCTPGYISDDSRSTCVACEAGKWANATSNTCEVCDGNTISARGDAFCEECPWGQIHTNHVLCQNCTSSQFHKQQNDTACTSCAVGYFSAYDGQTSCDACDLGTYNPIVGQAECLLCPNGQYMNTKNATACTLCPPNTFRLNNGTSASLGPLNASSCVQCEPGTKANAQRTGCSPCNPGQYQVVDECRTCNISQNLVNRVAKQTACLTCAPGFTAVAPTLCLACPSGKFHGPDLQLPICSDCFSGYYAPVSNMTRCTACAPGQYMPTTGALVCSLCDAGYFAANLSSTTCVQCPNRSIALTGASNCTLCPAGMIADATQGSCQTCTAGTITLHCHPTLTSLAVVIVQSQRFDLYVSICLCACRYLPRHDVAKCMHGLRGQ